jgi:hypothetical protein
MTEDANPLAFSALAGDGEPAAPDVDVVLLEVGELDVDHVDVVGSSMRRTA